MKEGNAFTNILLLMKEQGYNKDSDILVGKVKSVSPLEIDLGKILLKEEDMFIPETLKDHELEIELTIDTLTGTTKPAGVESHSHDLDKFNITKGKMKIKSPLKVNDGVIVFVQDSNFYLICKVVG